MNPARLLLGAALLTMTFLMFPCFTCAEVELNVHIIPHSHCDPGWLTTFDGYYNEKVQHILSRVIDEIEKDPSRTFTWAEISFFSRWYDGQGPEVKSRVKALVQRGQFEFVAGGWVQNDEANANYDIVIDQITEGHEYILKHFGVRPKIAWQIDPFGHSSLTPSIFAQMGFSALVINRIHYNTKNVFKEAKHMEFVWRGSHSLKDKSDLLTHVLFKHYSAPAGFDWEEGSPAIDDHSVPHRAAEFVREMRSRSNAYTTSNILVTWGDDFKFVQAGYQFQNMDRLIKYVNDHFDQFHVRMAYSTPQQYFKAVNSEATKSNTKFPLYVGDFFPYADNEDSYWTGYYTTRPRIKTESRRTDGILAAAESAFAIAMSFLSKAENHHPWAKHLSGLEQGRRDASLVQHHDGITGTAKSWVGADYLKRLSQATSSAYESLTFALGLLLRRNGEAAPPLTFEHELISVTDGTTTPIVVYNSRGWRRSEFTWVRLRSPKPSCVVVTDGSGQPVPAQILPFLDGATSDTTQEKLFFLVDLPPVGASTYFVASGPDNSPSCAGLYELFSMTPGDKQATIENETYELTISSDTLLIGSVKNKLNGRISTVSQDILRYSTHNSGAYIFRSTGPAQPYNPSTRKLCIAKGSLIQQFGVSMGSRRTIMTLFSTIAKDTAKVIEQEFYVNAENGEEVILRYSSDLKTAGTWYTDNGLEMIPRVRKQDTAPHKNYYPCPSTAYISDGEVQLTLLTSHAVGVSSLKDGELEIMIHRRLQQDDGRGLGEPVNDDSTVRITTWLMVDSPTESQKQRRRASVLLNHPLQVLHSKEAISRGEWLRRFYYSFSALAAPIPDNVHLITLRVREASDLTLRLLHTQEADEDNELSVVVMLDILPLFAGLRIDRVAHTVLSLNADYETISSRWMWQNSGKSDFSSISFASFADDSGQNSNEKGVFISQAALEAAKAHSIPSGRSLLSVPQHPISLIPLEAQAFILTVSPFGMPLYDRAAANVESANTKTPASGAVPASQLATQQHTSPPLLPSRTELPKAPPHAMRAKPTKADKSTSSPSISLSALLVICVLLSVFFILRSQRNNFRIPFLRTVPADASKLH